MFLELVPKSGWQMMALSRRQMIPIIQAFENMPWMEVLMAVPKYISFCQFLL